MAIQYSSDLSRAEPGLLRGFFEGWPNPPSPETHLEVLRGSSHVVLAMDAGEIVGFVNAISDGVLSAYLPLLEVRPAYRGRGIGSELVRRILEQLEDLYMVDLSCDPELAPFYQRFGLVSGHAMLRRDYSVQSGRREGSHA
jgi:ribosomal protein S18 acetylase RimI-like enzyme